MKILDYFKKQETINEYDFNLLPDGVFTLAQDGKIIDINDKILEIFDMTRFDILGRYFSDFVEDGLNILNNLVAQGGYAVAKAASKNKQNPFFIELSVAKNLETSKVYISVRDVTEKENQKAIDKEKYTTAKRIVDGKNEFLLENSAGLLSSIVSIGGFSKALLDGIAGATSEKQQKYLNIINQNARDLNYDLEKLFMLFRLESNKIQYNCKSFDLISLIKSIERIYKKDFEDRQIIFSLDYSGLTQRDCNLDSEIIEYILRLIMDIFQRFANLGKCSFNIGHPPIDFLKSREFPSNDQTTSENYVLFEAKVTDLVLNEDELTNIFDIYYNTPQKRPIGLRASFNLLKYYIDDFKGGIWVYSKQNFGTMVTFVLPLK